MIINLQKDMLLMKQRQAGAENLRNSEIKEIQKSVENLDTRVRQSVDENIAKIQQRVKDVDDSVVSERLRCKGEQLNYSKQLKQVQDSMIQIQSVTQHIQQSLNTPEPDYTNVNSNIELVATADNEEAENQCLGKELNQCRIHVPPSQDMSYAEALNRNTEQEREPDDLFGNMRIPTIITAKRKPKKKQKTDTTRNKDSVRDINFKRIYQELSASKSDGQNISENYAYNSNVHHVDGNADEKEDAEFDQYVKRRTRRFYLGGFRPNITETKIAGYITRRGLKVTKISISRNRGKYKNNVVIQVNVQDSENTASMTDDPYFWPEGVVCRPWNTRGAYRKHRNHYNMDNADYENEEYDYGRNQYKNSDEYDYNRNHYKNNDEYDYDRSQHDDNRYSILECDID